jgi:hypothetical protein
MQELILKPQSTNLGNICADHTRRLQFLFGEFWRGDYSMEEYRKKSRELTQLFADELQAWLAGNISKAVGTGSSDTLILTRVLEQLLPPGC